MYVPIENIFIWPLEHYKFFELSIQFYLNKTVWFNNYPILIVEMYLNNDSEQIKVAWFNFFTFFFFHMIGYYHNMGKVFLKCTSKLKPHYKKYVCLKKSKYCLII